MAPLCRHPSTASLWNKCACWAAGLSNVGFNVGIGNIGSAMSIFGFVFFIQPIMMAMLQEMPVRFR